MVAQVKSIRALERGLQVLRCLQEAGGTTLHDLHAALNLPKATLLRVLRTLEEGGFVWRGLNDGRYHAGQMLKVLGNRLEPLDRLQEVAGPILDDLVGKILWPSDLSVPHDTWMQLCETSRQRSHLSINRLAIGFRIDMLMSAPGRAYLAFSPETTRRAILSKLRQEGDPAYLQLGGKSAIEQLLAATRERGYGIRDTRWGGRIDASKIQYDDGLAAIAVPILGTTGVIGCINIVWIAKLIKTEVIVRKHLTQLQEAARLIASAYEALDDLQVR